MDDALELGTHLRFSQIRDALGAARTYNNMGHIFRRRRILVAHSRSGTSRMLDKKNPELNEARR